jgi:hypothetical protein
MKRLITGALLVLLVTGLSGCGEEATVETTTESPLSTASPLATPTSVPTPTSSPDESTMSIPAPAPGKGTITGRFVDYQSGEPGPETVVYLGELSPVELEGDETHIVSMNPDSSPSTGTDKDGYFVFQDVEPGTYAMVMWTPGNSWVVSDPDTKLDILVTVEADQITDLGEVETDLPG